MALRPRSQISWKSLKCRRLSCRPRQLACGRRFPGPAWLQYAICGCSSWNRANSAPKGERVLNRLLELVCPLPILSVDIKWVSIAGAGLSASHYDVPGRLLVGF